ncbi:MAG: OB-fold nucleic acid binding domain-containing protein [Bacteriovoracaceae bacterium]|jgi:3'-5' exoribonuclease|nr:OB-fold nucleic acid binding domain-containing protein [Bacteriovoracaceae bacterium]
MSRITVNSLSPKDNIESTFLVKHIALMEAKDGKKYLNIILSDATGDIEARVWNDAADIFEKIEKGSFVIAAGKVNLYQGRRQFVIAKLEKIEASKVDEDEFIEKSELNPDMMFMDLMAIVGRLTDVYIKELIENILNDAEIQRRLKTWQAGKSIHHAYKSGLLEHILSCATLAETLSSHYQCNKNYVIAGAILHDLCKIYELSDGATVDYTEEGKLVGHLVKSLEIIDRFSYKIKGFPYSLKLHLKHVMLSHHGEYEYGSPKIPQTTEAMLVHLIDLMDSKMHAFETIKKNDNQVGHWSSFVRHLDRIIYKKDLPFFDKKVEQIPKKNDSNVKNDTMSKLLKDFKV